MHATPVAGSGHSGGNAEAGEDPPHDGEAGRESKQDFEPFRHLGYRLYCISNHAYFAASRSRRSRGYDGRVHGALSGGLPRLAVSGNQIRLASSGRRILLRGVNRSGLEYSEPAERGFRDAAGLSDGEIARMVREWNASVIRLPFNQDWVLRGRGGRPGDEYLAEIDSVIRSAAAFGAYTVLDLQWLTADATYGAGNFVAPLPNGDSIALWRLLADRYRDEPAVLFDLFNEPHDALPDDPHPLVRPDGSAVEGGRRTVTMEDWREWAVRLIREIREVHPAAVIFVSGVDWGYDLRGMPFEEEGLVYSTHVYRNKGEYWGDWFAAFGHLSAVAPVFAGEWGGGADDVEWGERLADFFDEFEMGWTAWSWSDDPRLERDGEPTAFGELVRRRLA
jgi:hypothetical protein